MSRFELSITANYVPNWGLWEAFRELFQNCIDQQELHEDNPMFWDYDADKQVFYLGNSKSVLHRQSLLLGHTTKTDEVRAIGKYGEGYKLALLVLTRLGKEVTIYNYGAGEIWYPKLINSRRYKSEILVIDVEKKRFWEKTPSNDLTFEVKDITPEDFAIIKDRNLHMQLREDIIRYEAVDGNILKSGGGRIYVNGLYVCHSPELKYSYDFRPHMLDLDRDRSLVKDFDLQWATSTLWTQVGRDPELVAEVAELVVKDTKHKDFRYLASVASAYAALGSGDEIPAKAYELFVEEYGEEAVPVSSQYEASTVPKGYKPVFVSQANMEILKASPAYKRPEPKEKEPTLLEEIKGWLAEHVDAEDTYNILSAESREALLKIARKHTEIDDLPF